MKCHLYENVGRFCLNCSLGKLPRGASAISDPQLSFHGEHLCDLGSNLWENLYVVRKSCEENKWTQAVQDTKGEIADRGKTAEMGTVSSSRTQRENHQSCKLWNLQVKNHRRWELSSSKELLMLSFGACIHVILLCILGNKSLLLLLSWVYPACRASFHAQIQWPWKVTPFSSFCISFANLILGTAHSTCV